MDVYNFSQQKSDEEILKEILAKHNLSINDFTVYHSTSKIPSYFDQPALWYMIEDNKVKRLRINNKKEVTHLDLSGLTNLEKLNLEDCENLNEIILSRRVKSKINIIGNLYKLNIIWK